MDGRGLCAQSGTSGRVLPVRYCRLASYPSPSRARARFVCGFHRRGCRPREGSVAGCGCTQRSPTDRSARPRSAADRRPGRASLLGAVAGVHLRATLNDLVWKLLGVQLPVRRDAALVRGAGLKRRCHESARSREVPSLPGDDQRRLASRISSARDVESVNGVIWAAPRRTCSRLPATRSASAAMSAGLDTWSNSAAIRVSGTSRRETSSDLS